jgi:uncharacterized protein YggU (UPF0235/DUF167 family)
MIYLFAQSLTIISRCFDFCFPLFSELSDSSLHVRVAAAPIDGEANLALLSFLASTLRLRKSTLSVGRGSTGRTKSIVVDAAANDHLSAEELLRRVEEAANTANDGD